MPLPSNAAEGLITISTNRTPSRSASEELLTISDSRNNKLRLWSGSLDVDLLKAGNRAGTPCPISGKDLAKLKDDITKAGKKIGWNSMSSDGKLTDTETYVVPLGKFDLVKSCEVITR